MEEASTDKWKPPLNLVGAMARGSFLPVAQDLFLIDLALQPKVRRWLLAAGGLDGICHQQRRWAGRWQTRC